MPHECCARRLLRTINYVGVMFLCCQNPKHGCGFSNEATLCKKRYDEKKQKRKLKCCFPLRDDQDCHGNLVSCPRRLFPVFDCFGKDINTGTFICEAHLKKTKESAITKPTLRQKSKTFASVNSTLSRNITLRNKTFCGPLRQPHPRPQTHPQSQIYLFH